MRFEFEVNLKKVRHIAISKEKEIKKEPALRKNLILAYQMQKLFDGGKAKNLKQLSGWLHMSHARISQIMSLLFLVPNIQEQILLSDKREISVLTEHRIRKVAIEADWGKQKELWERALSKC